MNEEGERKLLQKCYSRGKSVMPGKHVFQFMKVADVRDNGRSARVTKSGSLHIIFLVNVTSNIADSSGWH